MDNDETGQRIAAARLRGQLALEAYAGGVVPEEAAEARLVGLLADVMHLVDGYALDFDDLVEQASILHSDDRTVHEFPPRKGALI